MFLSYERRIKIGKKIKILRLILNLKETSGVYYQTIVPQKSLLDQTILSIFKSNVNVDGFDFYHSKGSIINYIFLMRKIISKNDFDLIHAHTPHVGILYLFCITLFRKKKINKSLFSVHYDFNYIKKRNQFFLFFIFLLFDKIIFCSKASRDSFPKYYLFLAQNKYEVIYNGVDLKKIKKKSSKPNKDDFKLITLSRLDKNKNIIRVIKAIHNLNDISFNLMIVGDGPIANKLKKTVKLLKLEKQITFYGLVSREKAFEFLQEANLFVSMSKTEAHSVAVLEALATGLPCVLSNIPSHREVALNKYCVKLAGHNNLIEIIKESKNSCIKRFEEISELSRNIVGKNFTQEMMTKKYFESYLGLIKENLE